MAVSLNKAKILFVQTKSEMESAKIKSESYIL